MEVIDIGLSDLDSISMNFNDSKPSMNFGPGIELLMNDKKKSTSNNINIDLGDLDNLENELNHLSGQNLESASNSTNTAETKTLSGFASNMFGFDTAPKHADIKTVNTSTDSNVGQATAESMGNTKTWDGFTKMNEMPTNNASSFSSSSNMNDRERRRKKRAMIKKLEEWHEKGLTKNNSRFNMDSVYEEVEDEYESALEDKRKKDSMKLQGWWFMTFVNSLEYANTAFNPFDLNLDGWGEQVSEDIDSYEEIFSELHDKYKGGKLAPEISLALRMGFSACVVNFTNKALSTATPGFNDVIKQSPELMRMFTNATVSSMSQQSPGFEFANNMMQEQANRPRGPPPPGAVETKNQGGVPRPGMTYTEAPGNRPDISAGRGAMFREPGIEMNQPGSFNNAPTQQMLYTPPAQPPARPEMRGPVSSDIDNILSGLKTRTVNIHEQPAQEDDSMISISSLKDIQNANMPKKSNRRKSRSERNTISLDI